MLFFILIVGATVFTRSFFGYRTSRTHIMSSLYCTTRANTLFDCSYSSLLAVTSCGDENIAGVVCLGTQLYLMTNEIISILQMLALLVL